MYPPTQVFNLPTCLPSLFKPQIYLPTYLLGLLNIGTILDDGMEGLNSRVKTFGV
jgi:hypothetical protein